MAHLPTPADYLALTRRDLLRRSGLGFGMLGLTGVLAADGLLATAAQARRPRRQSAGSAGTALSRPRPSASSICS